MTLNTVMQKIDHDSSTTGGSSISSSKENDITIGGQEDECLISLLQDSDLIESALDTVCKVKNTSVQNQAMNLLMALKQIIKSLQNRKVGLSHLPPLWAKELEDGSILLEWAFPDFRVGFGIEPNADDSSWYLVSNKKLEDINASGNLTKKNFEGTIIRLFSFILANS